MQLLNHFEDYSDQKTPVVLSIGNFDGVHRGHLSVLQKVKSTARDQARTVVITFSNHPSEILRPNQPTRLLCTLPHKIHLLEEQEVDTLIVLPFTHYLAQHSAASFIERVRQFIPFTHLVLGHDATLGRDRQGNRETMQNLGEMWGFTVHYIEEYRYEGSPVSSTHIRQLVQQGELEKAEILLDRPYSIYGSVSSGQGKGKQLGFPTANLEVNGLCLPPLGVYAVEVKLGKEIFQGIANLGIAPTMREDGQPLLEVHVFASKQNFQEKTIEVIFLQYIRPERKFADADELRQQIQKDIEQVKQYKRRKPAFDF